MNTKNSCSKHIMHELPKNKANFLFKTTQDFNWTRHAAPHLLIVFTDTIILYFNYLACVLFCDHFTVYAYQTSEIFLQTKHLKFYFKKRNHFRDEMTRLVINTRLFTILKSVAMLKIIEFFLIMHSALCGWMHFEMFHYVFFGRWFCLCAISKMAMNTEHCEM